MPGNIDPARHAVSLAHGFGAFHTAGEDSKSVIRINTTGGGLAINDLTVGGTGVTSKDPTRDLYLTSLSDVQLESAATMANCCQ